MIRTFDRVTLFSAVSVFLKERMVAAGLDARRIRVRSNFVWPSVRRAGSGSYFAVVGRLSEEKGVDTVLGALPPSTPLIVAGDGPERLKLIRMKPASAEFIGAVDGSVVPEILANARALLVPSRCYEGQPRIILEAFAAGVPVLASRVGGLPELVRDGVNGVLIDLDDTVGWRAALERLGDDGLSEELGAGAFDTWQECFGPQRALQSIESLYSEATARVT
jgi:glycosyltransferase involved in cell wall biosynthesis